MHGLLDGLVVGGVLTASVVYVLLSLGPRALRRRLLSGAAAVLAILPHAVGLEGVAERLRTAAQGKAKGACGGCDNCVPADGKAAAGAATADAASPTAAAPAEIRIPLSKIGRR